MKLAALVWLTCLAIYLELLSRRRVGGSRALHVPWPDLILGIGVLLTLGWGLALGWFATDGLKWLAARLR